MKRSATIVLCMMVTLLAGAKGVDLSSLLSKDSLRTVIINTPGTLYSAMEKINPSQLDKIKELRVCGPLNGDDISTIHNYIGQETEYKNIKTLDLSRSWIVTDSAFYCSQEKKMSHERFMNLMGKRSEFNIVTLLKNSHIRNKGLLLKKTFNIVQSYDGYTVEVIPDSLYFKFYKTIEGRLSAAMLRFPYIEHIRLPEDITVVECYAVFDCPQLQDVTIPKSVKSFARGAFLGNDKLSVIKVPSDSPILKYDSLYLNDHESGPFIECRPDIHLETYNTEEPKVTFSVHVKTDSATRPRAISNMTYPLTNTPSKRESYDCSKGEFDCVMTEPRNSCMTFSDHTNFVAEEGVHYFVDNINDTVTSNSPLTKELNKWIPQMYKLKRELSQLRGKYSRETDPSVFKPLREKINGVQSDLDMMMVKAYYANTENYIPAALMGRFHRDLSLEVVQGLLATMNDRNTICDGVNHVWRYVRNKTSIDDIDWYEYADTAKMMKINVTEPGTLQSLLPDSVMKTVHRLYVSGKINNDDIRHLHNYKISHLVALDLYDVEMTYFPDTIFRFNGRLRYIRLPKTLKEIGKRAFMNNNLQFIILPEGLEKIGNSAFYNSMLLKSIVIPNSVKQIGFGAFAGSERLRNVRLPKSLVWLEETAFARCPYLRQLDFPAATKHIQGNLYADCPDLKITVDPANPYYKVVEGKLIRISNDNQVKNKQK